ncbi:DUF1489 domain-containing protein [Lichenicola cladoniae]|uniref:DUF1489 domain-containing protein n=1 Tax=Lichenicola cladoniae TaxID=1484109 RepID=A0A6M8HVE4_9PROT|nr:DUF1489 domain-containing protein [Lichenicola cladoniae]NPD69514.1 DUF1489 domain-containing protein [Acetobacteraceae bacterium]QKE92121.1 DUF1489 domain-containing protein [Lichenicola cladoniae]
MALNLIKLAVGVATPEALAERQAMRSHETGAHDGRPFFRTRSFPRRAAEVLDGGSIYWVTAGMLLCRQEIHDIVQDRRDDGTPCTGVVLHASIVPVVPRAVRAFQGWRYLTEPDAPVDLVGNPATGDELPLALRRELLALCLL